MPSLGNTILSSLYAVINMWIPVMIGVLTIRFGVLNSQTRKVLRDVNYYIFIPVYSFVFIMSAISREKLPEFGFLMFSCAPCIFIGFGITYTFVWFAKLDARIRLSYTCAVVYANFVIMPLILTTSLCYADSEYGDYFACKREFIEEYSALPIVFTFLLFWGSGIPMVTREREITLSLKKIVVVVLNYYATVDDFLKDPNFEHYKQLTLDRIRIKNNNTTDENIQEVVVESKEKQEKAKQEVNKAAVTFTSKVFITEYYRRNFDYNLYKLTQRKYKEFEKKVFNTAQQETNKKIIDEMILKPENILEKPKKEKLCSAYFLVRGILRSPAIISALVAIVLGFIFPFKEWLFDPNNFPFNIFISTLEKIGRAMPYIALMLVGARLPGGARIRPDLLISCKHIIGAILVKNLILPVIGLAWVFVIMSRVQPGIYGERIILAYMAYTYWIVPNALQLVSVFAISGHFSDELAAIAAYVYLSATVSMPAFSAIFFWLYHKTTLS